MIKRYDEFDKKNVLNLYRDLILPKYTISKLNDNHYKKFLYIKDGSILGIIVFDIPYVVLNIFNLYIDKNFRNSGVGSELIKFVEEYAIKRKLDGIRVSTSSNNIISQNFYLNHGFSSMGKINNYNSEEKEAIFFYKSLKIKTKNTFF